MINLVLQISLENSECMLVEVPGVKYFIFVISITGPDKLSTICRSIIKSSLLCTLYPYKN